MLAVALASWLLAQSWCWQAVPGATAYIIRHRPMVEDCWKPERGRVVLRHEVVPDLDELTALGCEPGETLFECGFDPDTGSVCAPSGRRPACRGRQPSPSSPAATEPGPFWAPFSSDVPTTS